MSSVRAERQLILLSAGTATRRKALAEQAKRLGGAVDWAVLAENLRRRRLLTALGPRLVELTERPHDDEFAARVRRAIEAGRRHGAFLQLVSLRVAGMLADAGIRSTALKGPLLGEALYGDPGRRLSGDIDLLIAPGELNAAVEVVRTLGYKAPTDHVYDSGLPLLHFVLVHERDELPPVELHWRIHWYERRFAQERLLAPASTAPPDWRPPPADELAALLLFYARDGFVDLRMASDLSEWWDRYGEALPGGALEELLDAYPALARVLPVAAAVAERTVGLPARRIMGSAPRPGPRERMAARLVNPNPSSSRSQLYADVGLIDGLLMPPGGFGAFVRRQLLPPVEVLDQHARHADRSRARSRLGRFLGVLARYGVTLTRLARAPEALPEPHHRV